MVQIKYASNQPPKKNTKKKVKKVSFNVPVSNEAVQSLNSEVQAKNRKLKKVVENKVDEMKAIGVKRKSSSKEDDEDYIPKEMSKDLSIKSSKRTKETTTIVSVGEPSQRVPNKQVHIETHFRPGAVVEIFTNFTNDQLKSVEEIGFGGLYNLKMTKFYQDMVPWLVQNFHPTSQRFVVNGASFHVTRDDIYDIFCLPKGDTKILKIEKFRMRKNPDDSYMDELKQAFNLKEDQTLPTAALGKAIMDLKEGGPLFKKYFVLYVCSTFLAPSSNGTVDFYIAKAIHNVDSIAKLDWCTFVLDTLCYAINSYNNSIQKARKDGKEVGSKSIKGCVLVLELLYFHRFMFKGVKEPSDIPLIQHWTDEKLNKRVFEEKKASFGDCNMDKKTYPVSLRMQSDVDKTLKLNSSDNNTSPTFITSSSKRVVQFDLPNGLETDDEIKSKTNDGVQRLVLLLKRDLDLFNSIQVSRLNLIKEEIKKNAPLMSTSKDASQSVNLSQMDKIFSDPNTLVKIDKIVENIIQASKLAMDMPSFELFKEDDVSQSNNDTILENIGTGGLDYEHEIKDFNLSFDLLSFLSPYNCGEPSDQLIHFSDHMSKNKQVMAVLPSLQQEVVDYCMFNEEAEFQRFRMSRMETLFKFNNDEYVLSREEINTLNVFNKVSSAVIRVWSILLNANERFKKEEPIRFFFGVDQMFFFKQAVDAYNEEDLAVRDEKMKKQNINLQNCLRSWVLKTCNSADHLLRANMVSYLINVLQELEDQRACIISSFLIEVVPFDWVIKLPNVDCGIFMMLHMMFFEGEKFTADFDKAMKRRVYRSSICATIVLHDLNDQRTQLLKNVRSFNKKKIVDQAKKKTNDHQPIKSKMKTKK